MDCGTKIITIFLMAIAIGLFAWAFWSLAKHILEWRKGRREEMEREIAHEYQKKESQKDQEREDRMLLDFLKNNLKYKVNIWSLVGEGRGITENSALEQAVLKIVRKELESQKTQTKKQPTKKGKKK